MTTYLLYITLFKMRLGDWLYLDMKWPSCWDLCLLKCTTLFCKQFKSPDNAIIFQLAVDFLFKGIWCKYSIYITVILEKECT
jgi:hypothetical protein